MPVEAEVGDVRATVQRVCGGDGDDEPSSDARYTEGVRTVIWDTDGAGAAIAFVAVGCGEHARAGMKRPVVMCGNFCPHRTAGTATGTAITTTTIASILTTTVSDLSGAGVCRNARKMRGAVAS